MFELGSRDLGLCESLLIDPSTDHVVDVHFDLDTLILDQSSFDYIKQNLDLFAFTDPSAKAKT